MNICKQCQTSFEITDGDRRFYEKVEVPEPTLCPDCRLQRRLAFRNERALFRRLCDLCHKHIVAPFDKNVPFPVYCNDCWWSDDWSALDYGQDYDFSRPFFDQFNDLMMKVPKAGMFQLDSENCDYNTLLAYSKNTYLSPGSYFMEDCYYARKSRNCKDCVYSNALDHCELVAFGVNSSNCYQSSNIINCNSCSNSMYLADCIGCSDCFMCSGLKNAQYCFKNKKYSKDEYYKIVGEYVLKNSEALYKEFFDFNRTIPKKYQNQINCQDCVGDYLHNSKNAVECYDCFDLEDTKYVVESSGVKDSMDQSMHDKDNELCYEVSAGGESNVRTKFSYCPCASPGSEYTYSCFYLKDSFGCTDFNKRNSNCILNKKYSPDEYSELRRKIIEKMRSDGEYGEFFPISLSLCPYNESIAQDYFPLSKEEAVKRGCKWRDKDPKHYKPAEEKIPDSIKDLGDELVDKILACVKCTKNYKVIPQEFNLCRKLAILPTKLCADCVNFDLISRKNPRKLYDRNCAKCQIPIKTSYSPDRPEVVYCEQCYLNEVY